MMLTLGRLLGLDNLDAIESFDLSLAAPWAEDKPFWVFVIAAALWAGSFWFYARWQRQALRPIRVTLGLLRGSLLTLLFLMLADPVLHLRLVHQHLPVLYVVFDNTESMAIEDDLSSGERAAIESAAALNHGESSSKPARRDYLKSLIRKNRDNVLSRLAANGRAELEVFKFDGTATSQLHKLASIARPGQLNRELIASQLTASGQVTALGSALDEIQQHFTSRRLAGIVLFSDFDQNAGPSPLGGPQSPAARLGVPIYTVGIGATSAVDLAVELQTDTKMKKAERSNIVILLRQSGLESRTAAVRLAAKKSSTAGNSPAQELVIGQKTVALSSPLQTIEFPFIPEDSGRFEFTAVADKLEGEATQQNNAASREINVIDDYLRLMYVAYEPTWEWRFVKEVFHRDKLVGVPGFRTFLSSSDPRVRETNVLFLPTLTPKRSDFFATDVLFLDDMPRAALTDRFCELTKEYVSKLGGGLVVIAGPRFGPRELSATPLADMLPVIIDPAAELRSAPDVPEFRPQITPHAARYSFMQLGADAAENKRAWDNLGKLAWYQPVAMPHPQAEVLLEHPTDKCADGKTPQPLIAIRPYGKGGAGEVVWIAFNEMWRLRRIYGEKYYRQFWSQLIYRLGMSHALGPEKRFVARIDQPQYRAEDKVTLLVEAFDENYEPLSDEALPRHGLEAELLLPSRTGTVSQSLLVPMRRKGVFEMQFPVDAVGSYTLQVIDPVTGHVHQQRFEVTAISAERRRGVRDLQLQQDLAQATGGKSYDLTTVHRLPEEIELQPIAEPITRIIALWTTPLWFIIVVVLMLGEWTGRKLVRLA